MSFTPLEYIKFLIFCKLLILRYQFIGITLSKRRSVCTFYDKQINAKKYEWKFGSVQALLVGACRSEQDSITTVTHQTDLTSPYVKSISFQ